MSGEDRVRAPNGKPEVTAEARFWAKVEKTEGCWNWTGVLAGGRYGQLMMGHRASVYAHRFSYELHREPIPEGMEIDHLCRNTRCVNPDHLEVVTPRENRLRSESLPAQNAKKTHCPKGHLYDEENTYTDPKGRREYRECVRQRQRRRYATDPAYRLRKSSRRA